MFFPKKSAEPDRQEILKETELQERYLDDIGSALDDMKRMGNVCHFSKPLKHDLYSLKGRCQNLHQNIMTLVIASIVCLYTWLGLIRILIKSG